MKQAYIATLPRSVLSNLPRRGRQTSPIPDVAIYARVREALISRDFPLAYDSLPEILTEDVKRRKLYMIEAKGRMTYEW